MRLEDQEKAEERGLNPFVKASLILAVEGEMEVGGGGQGEKERDWRESVFVCAFKLE